jgi:hypothetical protein
MAQRLSICSELFQKQPRLGRSMKQTGDLPALTIA